MKKIISIVVLTSLAMTAWAIDLGGLDKQLKQKIGDKPLNKESLQEAVKEAAPESAKAVLPTSEQEELKVGREVASNLLGAAPLVNDGALQRYVNTIGRWISLQGERPNLPWRFGIIESNDINAFAAPGGYILLTRGLYQRLNDETELAGVLAHEIAHVLKRHHIDVMRKQALIAEGGKAAEKAAGDDNAVIKNLVGNGAEIFARRLDQSAELEADRMAVVLAARAGYDPYGLPAALQTLEGVRSSDDRIKLLFKTHPTPTQRLTTLDKAMGSRMLSLGGASGGRLLLLPK
ncbi:MAG TPA: M48 family metalloprotease [Gammaproteobacteria bacterium]